jgi:hypothetical protein
MAVEQDGIVMEFYSALLECFINRCVDMRGLSDNLSHTNPDYKDEREQHCYSERYLSFRIHAIFLDGINFIFYSRKAISPP